MTGLLIPLGLILGGLLYWWLVRRDPLLTPDGAPTESPTSEPQDETDIGFQPAQLPELMGALGKAAPLGLTPAQTQLLADRAAQLDVDRDFIVQYHVPCRGGRVPLEITVFRDDIEDVTFYFRGPQSLIAGIEAEIDALREDH